MVRAGGLEPPRAKPDGFSYPPRLSPPRRFQRVRGLDYPFTLPCQSQGLGAARLVSTPSRPRWPGLARDCHLTGFPEFEQFYVAGFPARTHMMFKSVASTISPRPHGAGVYKPG